LKTEKRFFLDTYAMWEYLAGNKGYFRIISKAVLATSLLNLVELYYVVLLEHGEEPADGAYVAFRHYQVDATEDDVKEGMKLKLRMRSKGLNFSYADALGYAIAGRLGARFLTGDGVFKNLSNVDFLK